MAEPELDQPLVFVASGGEWSGRSLQVVLELGGYRVVRFREGRHILDFAREERPSALIIEDPLADLGALDVARVLRDDPHFNHATPVIVIAQSPVAASIRAEALSLGAWEYYTHPLDTDSLLLKLRTFIRAKLESDARATLFVDRANCLYSREALLAWARQLGSRARREREPLACVVVEPGNGETVGPGVRKGGESIEHLAEVWLNQGRRSDVVGRLTPTRLAIFAPATDSQGAIRLVERMRSALSDAAASGEDPRLAFRAGYSVLDDSDMSDLDAADLLRRAECALEYTEAGSHASAAHGFEQLPG